MGKTHWRPIEIARMIGMSTSTLRHYETWGIVPDVPRSPNGYRLYSNEHLAYFQCIRAMSPGFGMKFVSNIMIEIGRKDINSAIWMINDAQAALHSEKKIIDRTIDLLKHIDVTNKSTSPIEMNIKEVSIETQVPASAIRHWERLELIQIPRNENNGYRVFSMDMIKQILLIRTLRNALYPIHMIKKVIEEVKHNKIQLVIHIASQSLERINQRSLHQLRGCHYFYRLCDLLGYIGITDLTAPNHHKHI
jgi:DNA-binding transcriptional MerR regulator